jgi:hypothetical protein
VAPLADTIKCGGGRQPGWGRGCGTGGTGGTGGTSGGNCDYGDCLNEPNKSTCETLVGICEDAPMPDDLREFCIEGTNVDQCGER